MQGIQIIGTQRSGSNLFRLMLNQIEEINAPHPPHILDRFYPLLPYYDDLEDSNSFNKLIEDVCKLVNYNPVSWESIELDPKMIENRCRKNSLFEIFRALYEYNAELGKAKFWCCKSMANIFYTNQLEESGIHPKYIHLYRDGRDVAVSFKKAIVGDKHVYHLAKKWVKEQELCLELLHKLGNEQMLQVRYEDLIQNPEKILKNVCKFLHINYHPKMLNYNSSKESINTASSGKMWENVTKPIINDNYNKFKKELSIEEIQIFESIANDMLKTLGYESFLYVDSNKSKFTKEQIDSFNIQNVKLKAKILDTISKEDIKKRAQQQALLEKIKSSKIHQY